MQKRIKEETKKKGVLTFNPRSGRGKAVQLAQDFAATWHNEVGTELQVQPSRSADDLLHAVSENGKRPVIEIYMGGDGTFSLVISRKFQDNGFEPLQRPLGLLPSGSGNSFMRDFDIADYQAGREAFFAALAAGSSHRIDAGMLRYQALGQPDQSQVGEAVKRAFINFWGIGLVSEISRMAMQMRYLGGSNYLWATLWKLLRHRPQLLNYVADGENFQHEGNFLTLSSSRFTGGAMEIAPPVRVNDGRFLLLAPRINSRLRLFQLFPKLYSGKHLSDADVDRKFIRTLQMGEGSTYLMNIDGEVDEGFAPRIDMMPSSWALWMTSDRIPETHHGSTEI